MADCKRTKTLKNRVTNIIIGREQIQEAYGIGRRMLDTLMKAGAITHTVNNTLIVNIDEFEKSICNPATVTSKI